jgi:hypothetical protein
MIKAIYDIVRHFVRRRTQKEAAIANMQRQPHLADRRSCSVDTKDGSSALVIRASKLRMRVHMNGRQSDFKPDPVCALDSGREGFAVHCGYVMWWDVIFFVNGFVDA